MDGKEVRVRTAEDLTQGDIDGIAEFVRALAKRMDERTPEQKAAQKAGRKRLSKLQRRHGIS